MFFPEIVTGSIIIICGFLVKLFPDLIAGYNSLTDAEKKKVDITRLASFLRINLIVLGLLVIIIGFVLKYAGIRERYTLLTSSTLIILYIIVISFMSQKFYKR